MVRQYVVVALGALTLLVLGSSACSPTPMPGGSADRGSWSASDTADEGATCAEACGGMAKAGCWCDAACAQYGDCCPDVATVCSSSAESTAVCGRTCEWAGDCNPAEPYCNRDAGLCQPTPPQCTMDSDCSAGEQCHTDGYCYHVPRTNCRPGWGWFEGMCDNAACEQSECPEGTTLDPETCYCNGNEPAPSCSYAGDCNAAYPYCNYDTGSCQETPPKCVDDSGCEDGETCHSDGYCYHVPFVNCAPGWGWFEGACDNPACEQSECPAGTQLDPDTCACAPVCE